MPYTKEEFRLAVAELAAEQRIQLGELPELAEYEDYFAGRLDGDRADRVRQILVAHPEVAALFSDRDEDSDRALRRFRNRYGRRKMIAWRIAIFAMLVLSIVAASWFVHRQNARIAYLEKRNAVLTQNEASWKDTALRFERLNQECLQITFGGSVR